MPAQKTSDINLIPITGLEATPKGKLLAWLLGTFRNIVIAVEFVVIAGFAFRFYLDTQSDGLNDKIKERQVVIESYSEFEENFRSAQERLNVLARASSENAKSRVMEEAAGFLPAGSRLKSISLETGGATVEVLTESEASILQFISNLNSSQVIKKVKVLSVGLDEETGLILYSLHLDS